MSAVPTSRTRNSVIARSSTGYHGSAVQGDDGDDQRETDDQDVATGSSQGGAPQGASRADRRRLVQIGHEGESVSAGAPMARPGHHH